MAIYIKIEKVLENNDVGYYKVSRQDDKEADFYIGIDKPNRLIKFYLTEDFSEPFKVIDYRKNEPIGSMPGLNETAVVKALIQGIKALDLDTFPDFLDYAA